MFVDFSFISFNICVIFSKFMYLHVLKYYIILCILFVCKYLYFYYYIMQMEAATSAGSTLSWSPLSYLTSLLSTKFGQFFAFSHLHDFQWLGTFLLVVVLSYQMRNINRLMSKCVCVKISFHVSRDVLIWQRHFHIYALIDYFASSSIKYSFL